MLGVTVLAAVQDLVSEARPLGRATDLLFGCVTLFKFLNLSVPHSPHLQDGMNSRICLRGLLGFSEIIHVNCSAWPRVNSW